MRRHLHQVDVEVQKAGMVHRPGQIAEGGLEHLARLERAGPGRGLAGTRVPHLPGRTVEDRFCEDAAQIEVVGVRPVHEAHGVGKGVVPGSGRRWGRAVDSGRAAPRSARVPAR